MALISKDIAILDVTTRSICAIVGVKKAQSVFGIKSIYEKTHQGFIDGEWLDQDESISICKDVIKNAMKQSASRTRRIYIGVPSDYVSVVTKDLIYNCDKKRKITEEDVNEILTKGNTFKNDKYMLINVSSVFYMIDDSSSLYDNVIGLEANKIRARVSYSFCEKSFVEMFNSISKSLGFNNVNYLPTCLAEVNNLLDIEQKRSYSILIDISYLTTSVSLCKGNGIVGLKSFSMGGGNISADIFENLDVEFELAEEAKSLVDLNLNYGDDAILVGDADNNLYATDVCEITKSRLDMIAEILSNIIKDFESKFSDGMPLYLTGDGILSIRGAKKYLADQLGRDLETVSPKLPGFVKPEDASKVSLLLMADALPKYNFIKQLKKLIYGGNN